MNSWELNNKVMKLYRNHKQSTSSTINFHGGAVTSWKVLNLEQLFVKCESKFDNINPILGGIHVLFPNFNMDQINMPNNGFSRVCEWRNTTKPFTLNNNIAVEVELKENFVMKALRWDHPFQMNFTIILGLTTLTTIIAVHNPDPERTIYFNLALETFLRVRSVEQCQIQGLTGCEYTDKINCLRDFDRDSTLIIRDKIDRIYRNAKDQIFIHDLSESRKIRLNTVNFPDLAIINPSTSEYEHMICVVPGSIHRVFKLGPKQWIHAGQRLEILPLLPRQQFITM